MREQPDERREQLDPGCANREGAWPDQVASALPAAGPGNAGAQSPGPSEGRRVPRRGSPCAAAECTIPGPPRA